MPPIEAPPAQPVVAADDAAWEEPSYEAPPAVPVEPAAEDPLPPADDPSSAFEELDLPAPSGLVAELDEQADDSAELFPAPPVRPEPADDEDTLDGRPPTRPDSTLEWDPFTDGPGGETRS
jgi:hypothetical protein